MTKKLKWRLSTLPTPDEIRGLVSDGLLKKEEAREILFSSEEEKDRDKKSLESEIKFLRELVEKLSKDRTQIVETIKVVEKPYYHWTWWPYYQTWCVGTTTTSGTTTSGTTGTYTGSITTGTNNSFSSINTF